MKRFTKYIYLATMTLVMAGVLNSCLKDDDVEKTPQCAILSFSVGDIKSPIKTKNSAGEDTTIYRTISGSAILFNINQVTGEICNVDSLPSWVSLKKVVPSVVSNGYVEYLNTEKLGENEVSNYAQLDNGLDSIDFTSGVEFLVKATDNVSIKRYFAKINKSRNEADTLVWDTLNDNNLILTDLHKLVTDGAKLFVFAKDGLDIVMTSSQDGVEWTAPEKISDATIDVKSVIVFKNKFIALNSLGEIMSSSNGIQWVKATEQTAQRILANDANYLYIFAENKILASLDMETWTENGRVDIDMLPETNIMSQSYDFKTNANLQNVVMAGTLGENTVVWYKVSSQINENNQTWYYINNSEGNSYPLPYADELYIVNVDNLLLAYVTNFTEKTHSLYHSVDNGITWKEYTSYILPPNTLAPDLSSSFVAMDNKFWVVQSGDGDRKAKVWKGVLNTMK